MLPASSFFKRSVGVERMESGTGDVTAGTARSSHLAKDGVKINEASPPGRANLRLVKQTQDATVKSGSLIAVDDLRNMISIPSSHRHLCYIHNEIVDRYPVEDNFEKLVDVQQYFAEKNLKIDLNVPDLEHSKVFLLREDAAARLAKAAEMIKKMSDGEIIIRLLEAYRPSGVMEIHFEHVKRWLGVASCKEMSKREIFDRVEKWLVHEGNPGAHGSGGAVDVTLVVTESRRELTMGSPWLSDVPASHTWSQKVSDQERFNRSLLFAAMTMAGFVNMANEWWHYSYGDKYWAAFLDKPFAHYGQAKSR